MSHEDDYSDLFDSVVFFEENCQNQGYEDGFNEGKVNGWREGFEIGWQKGNQLGSEVGFYKGFVSTWLACCILNKQEYHRVKVKLESLWKLLSRDWSDNTRDLIPKLERIRAKFKQICSMLNINAEYSGTKASQLSF